MSRFAALLALSALVGCADIQPIAAIDLDALPAQERAQVDLGRALFFDEALSRAGDVSCGTCHQPENYGAEALPTSIGTGGVELRRNAPSVFNAALKDLQFWDGRATTLEEQALGPLLAEDEMNADPAAVEAHVASNYGAAFAMAFPDATAPTLDHVASALAAYQRTLPTPSRVDRYLNGDIDALSELEIAGLRQFRADCAFCHSGDGAGGDSFERLGDQIAWPSDRQDDLGRFEVTGNERDRMVFVVPSLRNVAQTAPYFHDGSVETLEEAVELMGHHQLGTRLPESEVTALVAFLQALDAETIPEHAFPPE
jgi:cytochrome c peroxidase